MIKLDLLAQQKFLFLVRVKSVYKLFCFVLFVFSLKLLKKTDKSDADMYITKSLNPIVKDFINFN